MFVKLVRIGRDAELRYTPSQKAVINLACVYDIGWGENKKSQWIDAAVWGKQAESLAQYLLKGKQIVISAEDIELEEFTKGDQSTGSKLKCRVVNIDLTDNKLQGQGGTSEPIRQGGQSGGQGGGFAKQQAQQSGFQQQQAPSQQLANKRQEAQQGAKVNPQEPTNIEFDDSIPF